MLQCLLKLIIAFEIPGPLLKEWPELQIKYANWIPSVSVVIVNCCQIQLHIAEMLLQQVVVLWQFMLEQCLVCLLAFTFARLTSLLLGCLTSLEEVTAPIKRTVQHIMTNKIKQTLYIWLIRELQRRLYGAFVTFRHSQAVSSIYAKLTMSGKISVTLFI